MYFSLIYNYIADRQVSVRSGYKRYKDTSGRVYLFFQGALSVLLQLVS